MNEEILNKIQRLLSLSNGNSNVNEAANAFKQAQKLMQQYQISQEMLEDNEDDIEDDVLFHGGKRLSRWKSVLANVVAEVNGCVAVRSRTRTGVVVEVYGLPSDIILVRTMYAHVAKEVDRLTLLESSRRNNPGKRWLTSFRAGVVSVVSRRLHEAKKEAQDDIINSSSKDEIVLVSHAIERINQKHEAALAHINEVLGGLKQKKTRTTVHPDAYERGKRAGENVDLRQRTPEHMKLG